MYLLVIGSRSLTMSDYLVGLENSGWLRHIKAIVDAAVFLAQVCFFSSSSIFLKLHFKAQQHNFVDFPIHVVLIKTLFCLIVTFVGISPPRQ